MSGCPRPLFSTVGRRRLSNTRRRDIAEETRELFSAGVKGQLTKNAPLLVEVAHELRLCEKDVVQLVHTELEDLIDMEPPVQVFMEGLHFTWERERVYVTSLFPFFTHH